MSALLLVLLVAVSVSSNPGLKTSESVVERLRIRMNGRRADKMGKLVSRIKEDFENIPKLRKKLSKCDGASPTRAALSSEREGFSEKREYQILNAPRLKGSIEDVNARSGIADKLFQGDMLLSIKQQEEILKDSESRSKRQAYNDKSYPGRRWLHVVNYTLDNSLDDTAKEAFKNATYLWMNDTCINFMEDATEEGKMEELEMVGVAVHEIGHALGFWHTHSRHDRDEFITIIKENINCSRFDQFMPPKTMEINNNYNLTYDYGSVMHYGATAFINETAAVDRSKLTMISKDALYKETLGSSIISFYDLLMMNMYYNCTDACEAGSDEKCENGGFAHPRNCSKCICPSGYGGQFCGERPPGCGAILNASENWQLLEDPLNATEVDKDGYKRCNYWIKAPDNKTVEVRIVEVPGEFYYEGCRNTGVEIKTHMDQRLTGYRFCSSSAVNITLASNLSMVPVITFKAEGFSEGEDYDYEYNEEDQSERQDEGEEESGSDYGNGNENEGTSEESESLGTIVKLEYRFV